MPDVYDRLKDIVMRPRVQPGEIKKFINGMVQDKVIGKNTAKNVRNMLNSIMDTKGYIDRFYRANPTKQEGLLQKIAEVNKNEARKALLGDAIVQTEQMIGNARETQALLQRYAA